MAEQALSTGGGRIASDQGQQYWLITDRFTFKLTGADTGGAFALAELTAQAESGPPPHIHRGADECFYVLEGQMAFTLAGHAFTAGPGDVVHLPRGVVHTHGAHGAQARALVLQTPAGVEHFIEEAGAPVTDASQLPGPPTMESLGRVIAIAAKHDIDVPPLG